MDSLDAIAIELPCSVCGSQYRVSLRQILLSRRMMRQGCPVPSQYATECPPQYYADLVDCELIQGFSEPGSVLRSAHAAAGRLS